jgi:hypothetical protein
MRPKLDDFISQAREKWPYNAWVTEPGFAELYVRVSWRPLENKMVQVIDLANITATKPGNGAFTKLVAKLREKYPELGIYVESVLNPRFDAKLLKMGFIERQEAPHNYYLLTTKEYSGA